MQDKTKLEELIGTKSLFNIFFWSYTCLYLPIAILLFILCIVGIVPLNINDKPYYGIGPAFGTLLYIPMVGFLLAGSNWLFLIAGFWIYKNIKKLILRFFKIKSEV
jgi:hypothetical protein